MHGSSVTTTVQPSSRQPAPRRVAASPYAELLDVSGEGEDAEPGTRGGDLDVLADLGTSPEALREMCDDELLPMDALASVAEAAGFAEVLDSLR